MAMQTTSIQSYRSIPLHLITPGANPRRFFDPTEMAELEASVYAKGVMSPIIVRPLGEGFSIIAGERRFRAALKVFGEDGEIPAKIVEDCNDEEAQSLALIENIIRANMSVTEEAVAAGRILAKNNNDRTETSMELGWPVSKLNRRLALLNLIQPVMDALNERRISVGIAELLAAVAQHKQEKALETIIAQNWNIEKVKALLLKASTEFSTAIFDTTGCGTCPNNSELQQSLFDVNIGSGRCTNQDCFKAKTSQQIQTIMSELSEEVPNVRLIEVGDATTYVPLSADGNLGVGADQLNACLGCSSYGATVSALPGEEGKIERSICFDSDCHRKQVTARLKAEKTANQTTTNASTKAKGKKPASAATGAAGPKKAAGLSERVKEYRRKQVWEKAATAELLSQLDKARAFVLDLMLSGDGGKVSHSQLDKAFGELSGGEEYPLNARSEGYPEKPYALDPDQQDNLFAAAAVAAIPAIEETRLQKLLSFLETDLGNHWQINAEYLSLLTKSEIESVCISVGLDVAVNDFCKVIGGKKDEAIKAIMSAEFIFNGVIPLMMNYL